jgi:hypothetical protein
MAPAVPDTRRDERNQSSQPNQGIDGFLASMETALADGHAELTTALGGIREVTRARLWQGKVLVDWEPDEAAGGCLLHPALVRRLISLHARTQLEPNLLTLIAPRQVVAALSPHHGDLVSKLGDHRRSLELRVRLRFKPDPSNPADLTYLGGDETYFVVERGARVMLLRLSAEVRIGTPRRSEHTSLAPL